MINAPNNIPDLEWTTSVLVEHKKHQRKHLPPKIVTKGVIKDFLNYHYEAELLRSNMINL